MSLAVRVCTSASFGPSHDDQISLDGLIQSKLTKSALVPSGLGALVRSLEYSSSRLFSLFCAENVLY